jgi:hypothetical protein
VFSISILTERVRVTPEMYRAGQDRTHVGEASPVRVDIDAIGLAIGLALM